MRGNGLAFARDDYQLRFGLYLASDRHVREHNAACRGFTLALNSLAAYTPAEYKAPLGGCAAPIDGSHATAYRASGVAAPDSWDWRSQGAVNAIKYRSICGSSWAFAVIVAQYCIVNKVLRSLSEQNLAEWVRWRDARGRIQLDNRGSSTPRPPATTPRRRDVAHRGVHRDHD
jgi:hypothetical protein